MYFCEEREKKQRENSKSSYKDFEINVCVHTYYTFARSSSEEYISSGVYF